MRGRIDDSLPPWLRRSALASTIFDHAPYLGIGRQLQWLAALLYHEPPTAECDRGEQRIVRGEHHRIRRIARDAGRRDRPSHAGGAHRHSGIAADSDQPPQRGTIETLR